MRLLVFNCLNITTFRGKNELFKNSLVHIGPFVSSYHSFTWLGSQKRSQCGPSQPIRAHHWAALTNQRPVFRSRDLVWPIRGELITSSHDLVLSDIILSPLCLQVGSQHLTTSYNFWTELDQSLSFISKYLVTLWSRTSAISLDGRLLFVLNQIWNRELLPQLWSCFNSLLFWEYDFI